MRGHLFVVLAFQLASCGSKPAPGVCCVSEADCESIGAANPQNPRPCDTGLACVDHECTLPADGGVNSCSTDNDCGGATPHCAPDGTCVGCIDSTQCPAAMPTCDSMTHACRTCASDDDCSSGVCDQTMGTCVDATDIVYASPTGSDSAACDMAAPCSITHAFDVAAAPRDTIKLLAGNYMASLNIAGKTLTVDGFGATLTAPDSMIALNIGSATTLRIVGLHVVGPNTNTFVIQEMDTADVLALDQVDISVAIGSPLSTEGTLTITRSQIHNHGVEPILLGGTISIDRSLIEGGDGINVTGTTSVGHITNSVIRDMGPDSAYIGGSFLGGPCGTLFVSFSTIVDSTLACPDGTPTCQGGSACGSCTDDSIILDTTATTANTVTGTACVTRFTLIEPQTTTPTGANNKIGIDPMLLDPANGNYHLGSASPAIDTADPAATDVTDFDGTPRPQGPRSDMGAFEFKR